MKLCTPLLPLLLFALLCGCSGSSAPRLESERVAGSDEPPLADRAAEDATVEAQGKNEKKASGCNLTEAKALLIAHPWSGTTKLPDGSPQIFTCAFFPDGSFLSQRRSCVDTGFEHGAFELFAKPTGCSMVVLPGASSDIKITEEQQQQNVTISLDIAQRRIAVTAGETRYLTPVLDEGEWRKFRATCDELLNTRELDDLGLSTTPVSEGSPDATTPR